MIYLLDVNALVALGFNDHVFHDRMTRWIEANSFPRLATCPTTELGFVRVLAQVPVYGFTAADARTSLLALKKMTDNPLTFIPDGNDISHLPLWVKNPKQVSDGHLVELAKTHGAMLATLDAKIPGSYLIA